MKSRGKQRWEEMRGGTLKAPAMPEGLSPSHGFGLDLEGALRKAMQGLKRRNDRQAVLRHLEKYALFLDTTQRLTQLQRLVLWACSFVIFDYLRCRKQLRPEVNGFDTNVKKIINDTIQKLMNDDGD